MTKTLSLTDVKTHLPRLVSGVQDRADEIVVTKNGKPAAIILNIEEYESFKETIEILSDPALMRQIRRSGKFYARGGRGVTIEEALPE
ncbi:MAG: type II toxin-antitoxin system Phd/YefM family antitoxin [Candidatus Coatesbacteria bacterium]